jgi:hypothetical protein
MPPKSSRSVGFEPSPTTFALGFQLTWGRRLALIQRSLKVSELGGGMGPEVGVGHLGSCVAVYDFPIVLFRIELSTAHKGLST